MAFHEPDSMGLPLDVFERRLSYANLWVQSVLNVKDNKLAAAAKAGEEAKAQRRRERIGLPPLFL